VIANRFTAKERDAETGLDYFGARYFSGAMGRFTSPDPILITKERLADPQRLNLYAYTRNNPLRYVDPNGEDFIIYTFYSKDLTDEQRKYLQANMKQIQAEISQKYKDAGVDKVEFRDGSSLSQKQISKILEMGRSTDTTGIGLLNFANKSFGGSSSTEGMLGATSSDEN
jgi:RHS repeat-associated protein